MQSYNGQKGNVLPAPNLIHPIPVQIEPLQRAQSLVDDDFREPIQQAVRSPRATVPGQIKWTSDEQLRVTDAGTQKGADGYVLFRRCDLRAAGLNEIHQSDRFVAIGAGANTTEVDLYVVRVQQMGHYPDQGGGSLVRAWFKDRQPSKQTRGGK